MPRDCVRSTLRLHERSKRRQNADNYLPINIKAAESYKALEQLRKFAMARWPQRSSVERCRHTSCYIAVLLQLYISAAT